MKKYTNALLLPYVFSAIRRKNLTKIRVLQLQ